MKHATSWLALLLVFCLTLPSGLTAAAAKQGETAQEQTFTITVGQSFQDADGNALVYEYQFTDEYDLSDEDIKQSVLDALKEGCEENASTFEDIADTLESEVGLSGVHVRLVYLNGDGSEIYTHDFE